ncbi:glycoside hydrolase family 43 protein [Algoriphagus pacificus]|uniref:Family 43 glycosylhydrolase n=1 Tax=Algoriphagus pacificus TaxID=2811234 RepID=A0ABS3CGU0_9BACT|nr:glycoside hydrolase family 43 protein [Algoriphagus pacificus]MBN7816313.1 family 43 glycosylhydrolase [Algoriphagus pacificus]
MRLIPFLALIFLLTYCQTKQEQAVSESKDEILQVHVIPGELPDPSMIEVDGVYYATGSSNDWGPLYPIYKSTDLIHWDFVSYVFQEIPGWTSSSFWAPELYYKDGKFFCFYTAKRKDGVSVIGVAITTDIQKGFEDQGELLAWGNEAIDAFVFEEDEQLYVSWKAYGLNPDKPITLIGSKLSEDGLRLEGGSFEMITAEAESWEKGGIEGQSIFEKDGYIYMLYSGNACCGAACDYMVGVARAKSFLGPWEKFEGNPILSSNENWKCPGHGTALKTGEDWFYLYHAYPAAGFPYLGRSTLLSQMFWEEGNSWPSFKVSETPAELNSLSSDWTDDFEGEELSRFWRYDIPAHQFESSLKDGNLQLTEKEREESNASGIFLGINPAQADFSMETTVLTSGEAMKSISLYATRDKSLGLGVQAGNLILWEVVDGAFEVLHEMNVEETEKIQLRAEVKDAHIALFSYSLDGDNWLTVTNQKEQKQEVIGDHLGFWSWGIKAGVSVKGQSNEATGLFEEFKIEYD